MSTINGYVARDKDGTLRFCYHKPKRENEIEQTWWGSCDADFDIWNDTLEEQFKDLTWEDEPVEVILSLAPANNQMSILCEFLRNEAGCGLHEAEEIIYKLLNVLGAKPVVFDKPKTLKMTWE
jgi:hypothetical protein